MTVTARLSKRFYDRFGDDIANELVNWFNDVDATYRADLIRTNDANYARFEAKLEQRLAEMGAAIRTEMAERFAQADVRLEKRFGEFRSEMLKWMVGLWITSMVPVGGMFFALLKLG